MNNNNNDNHEYSKVEKKDTENTIKNYNANFTYTAEEKKLVQKINFTTVPFICIIAFLQFLDKYTLNFSAVMGLFQDTGITGDQFAWLGSIYYMGYLVFQFPNQYLLQKCPLSKYLGTAIILWGITVGCTALATNFVQLAALRFLLGFFESVTYPALFLLIGVIYRRTEQVMFFGMISISNALGGAFAGLIGVGFLKLDGVHGLSPWKWCMVVFGCVTVGVGIFSFLFLPDRANSRWYRLTVEEQKIVQERIRDNSVIQHKVIKKEQIIESVKEIRFYCYFLLSFLINLTNACLVTFSTLIINSMGFSNMASVLLGVPTNIIPLIIIIICIYFSRYRSKQNSYIGAILSFIIFIALLLLTVLPLGPSMLSGIFLVGVAPVYLIFLTMISNNIRGYTKRVFYNGGILVAYCMGNFIGPLLMRQNEAPRYYSGMITYMVAIFISILLFLYLRYTYIRDNRYHQQLKTEKGLPSSIIDNDQMEDITDKEDLSFVYRL
ncbi:major facilitator superfamily domain-containing protein [Phascolomyces articulosus]|uniref:Major facilitator superfamily domain-containing protein n=1 Tax=Phascolomyces articulosus TaxID=60185 RepID=A0AAD5PL68_9FUNG|nr:major facilitator superfamily domain-containing protein [Phascolomyces articulosus]